MTNSVINPTSLEVTDTEVTADDVEDDLVEEGEIDLTEGERIAGFGDGEDVEIEIKGRHDPIIAPRATVVVEAMAALSIADLLLTGCTSRVENVLKIFGKN